MVVQGHAAGTGSTAKQEADHPFLAFVNTLEDDGKSRLLNRFGDASGLVEILAEAGLPVPRVPPGPAQMRDLLDLREAAYAVLSAHAARRPPPREDALLLEAVMKAALSDGGFAFTERGLRVSASPMGGLRDGLALSLFDLVTSPDFARLSECRRCTRLFMDHGRGRGRRWCDMARCGNRAKAESFRARRRAQAPD